MAKRFRTYRGRFAAAVGAAVAAALLVVPVAGADLGLTQAVLPNCGPTIYPFAQFGDPNAYYSFPNNGFENGSTSWTLTGGASVGKGNEPWNVNGSGKSSLTVPAGASAASPLVCINLLAPDWRMFARSNAANGALHAQIVFYGVTGNVTGILNVADLNPAGYSAWQPTSTISSLLALPLLTRYAQLRLNSNATSGSWQVDDIFVDPWASRG